MENTNSIFSKDEILQLAVTQDEYDKISLNRKSTFINLFDADNEFVVSVNTLDMKKGQDFLFLAEVLRAAEIAGLVPVNSLVSYKGLSFRLSAVQTTELNSPLKRNVAKKEDFQKKQAPQAPAQPIQQQAVF